MLSHKQIRDKLKKLESLNTDVWKTQDKEDDLYTQLESCGQEIEELGSKVSRLQQDLTEQVLKQSLNRREALPDDPVDFCSAVEGWLERASLIRRSSKVIYLDGRDLDIPDFDIPDDKNRVNRCCPCIVYNVLTEIMAEMSSETRDVLRARYGLHKNERSCHYPGYVAYQWYIAQQLNISRSTVSRRLRKAERMIRHPSRSDRLRQAMSERGHDEIRCPAEYIVARTHNAL